MIKQFTTSIIITLICAGCCQPANYWCVEDAEEFVIDSYRIKQGKLAILELQGEEPCELPMEAMCEYQDVICEDDILNIAVWHPIRRDLMDSFRFLNETVGFRVIAGLVDIPDIDPIFVHGLTLDEAKQTIQMQLQEQYKDIEVFVTYRDRLSRKVDLTGMVALTTVPVDGKIRLYEVLSKAHIPNGANLFTSYVLRCGKKLPVDLYRLMHEGDMDYNIVMRGGDKIYIADPNDARVMVMGEVLMPKPVPLPFGYMSLREALVSAGGIPFTGNRNCIQVIRGNMAKPKIYMLSWEQIIHLPNDSLLLMPGDTVYVSETPITQWNRFISQLLPSLAGAQTTSDVLKACTLY